MILGVSWAVLARLGRSLDVLWLRLGAPEGVLEASWGHLGASWRDLGMVLGSLGGFMGAFWDYFGIPFCPPGPLNRLFQAKLQMARPGYLRPKLQNYILVLGLSQRFLQSAHRGIGRTTF